MTKKIGNKDFLATAAIVIALGIGAIATAIVIRARLPKDDGSYIPQEVPITPAIELFQDYIRIPTTAGHEIEGARFLQKVLAKSGIQSEIIESGSGRANLYARIRGRTPGDGLLLLHHIDVEPADASKWSRPPFAGEISNNTLYGRGTIDMKGIGICHLAAFLDVAHSGETPEHDLVFLAVADEERGSHLGTEWLVEHRPDVFDGIRYATTEGGITELVREKVTYFAVQNGEKIFVRFRVHCKTRKDADTVRADLMKDFDKPMPDRIIPEVREYFSEIAKHHVVGADILADPDEAVKTGKFASLSPSYRMLTQNNISVGAVSGSEGDFAMDGIAALLPDEDPTHYIETLRARIKAHGGAETTIISQTAEDPVAVSSTSTPFFHALVEAVHAEYGADVPVGPYMFPRGGTDCRFLRPRGIACYGVLPYPVDFFESQTVHHPDERVRLDHFSEGVEMMKDLVRRYEFGH